MKKGNLFVKYAIPFLGWAVLIGLGIWGAIALGQAIVGGYRYYHKLTTNVVEETKKPASPLQKKTEETKKEVEVTSTSTTMATCHFAWVDNTKGVKPIRLWQYFSEERRWVAEIKPGERFGLKAPLNFQNDFLRVYTEEDGREGIYHDYYFPKKNPTEQSWDGRSR